LVVTLCVDPDAARYACSGVSVLDRLLLPVLPPVPELPPVPLVVTLCVDPDAARYACSGVSVLDRLLLPVLPPVSELPAVPELPPVPVVFVVTPLVLVDPEETPTFPQESGHTIVGRPPPVTLSIWRSLSGPAAVATPANSGTTKNPQSALLVSIPASETAA
jgi:hypothetical protein